MRALLQRRLIRAALALAAVIPAVSVSAWAEVMPGPVTCPVGAVCVPGVTLPQPPAQAPGQTRPSPSPSPSPLVPPGPGEPPVVPVTPQDNLQAVGQWVMGGANWSVCQIPSQLGVIVDAHKCPPDQAVRIRMPAAQDWFAPLYRRMIEIAGLLMLPMLLLAFLQALIRRDLGMAYRAAFGYVPLAVILSSIAVGVTQSLMAVTDSFSDYMLQGYQGQVAATIGSLAAVMAAGAAGSVFTVGTSAAAVIAALVALVAALAIVIELLARQALIYAGVLFLPLAFAGMVWPRLWAWTQRLVEVVIVAVFSKLLIVCILVLGAAAFTSVPPGGGPFDSQAPPGSTLLVGLLLVGLAAMAPMALFWMLPSLESAVLAQFHGAARGPISAAPHVVERSVYHMGLRRMWHDRSRAGAGAAARVMVVPPGSVIVRPPRYVPPGGRAGGGGAGPSQSGGSGAGGARSQPMTRGEAGNARAV